MGYFFLCLFGCQKSVDPSELDVMTSYPESYEEDGCGRVLAKHNGVEVYLNHGKGMHSCGEYHRSSDGYDYGPQWQCVEFVRRYYDLHLHHRFSTKGHAKHYFDEGTPHGARNKSRGLIQYRIGKEVKPEVDDILVCPKIPPGSGHVAIITKVEDNRLQIIQQNKLPAQEWITIERQASSWRLSWDCAGFLRKP